MSRRQKRFWRGMRLFGVVMLVLALGPTLVNLPRAWWACRVWESAPETRGTSSESAIQKIPDYYRPESKTYLTLPEWYVVYSTDEYAAFVQERSASDFPYFDAVGQFWESYIRSCEVIAGRYPFNGDSHFANGFIGLSFSAENMLKGAYEGTLGRLTAWASSGQPTEEEKYAAQVARDYGALMHTTPWYFFPFSEKLSGLWRETSLWGPDPLRKWERKLSLTAEYAVKSLYSSLTQWGADAAYGGVDVEKIYAITSGITPQMRSKDLELVEMLTGERQLVRITRFDFFSNNAPLWLAGGARFYEIAGNDEILFTLLGPAQAGYQFEHGETLFKLPILTSDQKMARVAVKVRVSEMGAFFEELKQMPQVRFEHFYDY